MPFVCVHLILKGSHAYYACYVFASKNLFTLAIYRKFNSYNTSIYMHIMSKLHSLIHFKCIE